MWPSSSCSRGVRTSRTTAPRASRRSASSGDTFWYGRDPRSIVVGSVGTAGHHKSRAEGAGVRGITSAAHGA
jgi:hypothetical protein